MTKALKVRDIVRSLLRKGFTEVSGRSHSVFWYTDGAGVGRIQTMVSRSSKGEVGAPLISDMARQCRLKRSDFVALVECSVTREDYRRKLRERGYQL